MVHVVLPLLTFLPMQEASWSSVLKVSEQHVD